MLRFLKKKLLPFLLLLCLVMQLTFTAEGGALTVNAANYSQSNNLTLPPFPDVTVTKDTTKSTSYVLDVYTDSLGTNGTIKFWIYGTLSGASSVTQIAVLSRNGFAANTHVTLPFISNQSFTLDRIDVQVSNGASNNWKPQIIQIVRTSESPVNYEPNNLDSNYPATSYSGTILYKYKTNGYTCRSNNVESYRCNPTSNDDKQRKVTSPVLNVDMKRTYAVISITSSDKLGEGLQPEGLIDANRKYRWNNNSRDIQFNLTFTDNNGVKQSQLYYPMRNVYFTSKYFESHPNQYADPYSADFNSNIQAVNNFDANFNNKKKFLDDDDTYGKYMDYSRTFFKYYWFAQGYQDSFIVQLPSYQSLDSCTISNSGMEDYNWTITDISVHSLDSFKSTYDQSTLHAVNTYTEPALYHLTPANGIFIAPGKNYTGNLTPGNPPEKDLDDTYIFSIKTDDSSGQGSAGTGTKSNVTIDLQYTDLNNLKQKLSLNTNELISTFVGNSSQLKFQPGTTDSFQVQIKDVKRFDSATLRINPASDDWQMRSLEIRKATSMGMRYCTNPQKSYYLIPLGSTILSYNEAVVDQVPAYIQKQGLGWQYFTTSSFSPYLRWERHFEGTLAASYNKLVYLQASSSSRTISFTDYQNPDDTEVLPEEDGLTSIPLEMSFDEVNKDLKLTKAKAMYTINVHVSDTADAGSASNFFFQLIFASGTSGVVLANEQLKGDAFRQGMMSSFQIQTNQTYGAVKGIRIYTSNTTADTGLGAGSEFDKLNIDKIEIIKNSGAGLSSSYLVEQVGWIDVGYTETNVEGTATDMAAANEDSGTNTVQTNSVCKEFTVTSLTSSMDFMMVLKTGNTGNASTGNGVVGNLTYLDTSGNYKVYTMKLDEMIHDYNGNSTLCFRQNKYDRLQFSLSNIAQLVSLQLVLGGSDAANDDWVCDSVEIFRVSNVGPVYLQEGEFIKDCDKVFITRSDNGPLTISPQFKDAKFIFQENQNMDVEFKMDSANDDVSFDVDSTVPASKDEKLNFYIFPSASYGKKLRSPLQLTCKYSTIYGGSYMQIAENIPASNTLDNGAMYLENVPITNLAAINGVALSTANNDTPGIGYVIVERITGGKLTNTYYINFGGIYLTNPFYATVDPTEEEGSMTQKVTMTIPPSTDVARLSASNDIGVSLRYRCSLDPTVIHKSPYTYLSSQSLNTITSGDPVTLTMNERNVGEILGVSLVTNGSQEFATDMLYITNTDAYGILLSNSGVGETITAVKSNSNQITYTAADSSLSGETYKQMVAPVELTFDTSNLPGAGTNVPVAAYITCATPDTNMLRLETDIASGKEFESLNVKTTQIYIPDLLQYLSKTGKNANTGFPQGTKTSLTLYLYNVGTILDIRLKPTGNDPWLLNSVTVKRMLPNGTFEIGTGSPTDWISQEQNDTINVRIPSLRNEEKESATTETTETTQGQPIQPDQPTITPPETTTEAPANNPGGTTIQPPDSTTVEPPTNTTTEPPATTAIPPETTTPPDSTTGGDTGGNTGSTATPPAQTTTQPPAAPT